MGEMYDYTEISFELISKLAKEGDSDALFYLAYRYYDVGNYKKSFALWKRAAELGCIDSMYHLGCSYYEGEGTKVDKELARYWISKSGIKNDLFN